MSDYRFSICFSKTGLRLMSKQEKLKKIVRLTTNNQVAIPAFIVRLLRLQKGSYLEVEEQGERIIMTPKKIVDR
ncbi:MAG: hypothetical protein A2Z83_04045 [Omnitrophica bacterium GWA2_52_8]|nr:MAG: hypothetical protein A2Z83_04045 [Omnitrophica bacterium GWA2_52_8]